MALMKLCSWAGCRQLVSMDEKYCSKHQEAAIKQKQYSNKYYDDNIRKNKEVYHNPIWIKLSKECKRKFKGLDIYSLYVLNKIEYGNISHHVETVEDCESRRYDLSDLIYLTGSNHVSIHSQYNISDKNKKEMQELLFSLIERYENEFGK